MKNNKGFTIIEVITVIAIISLIFLVLISVFSNLNQDLSDDHDELEETLIAQAFETFFHVRNNERTLLHFPEESTLKACIEARSLIENGYLEPQHTTIGNLYQVRVNPQGILSYHQIFPTNNCNNRNNACFNNIITNHCEFREANISGVVPGNVTAGSGTLDQVNDFSLNINSRTTNVNTFTVDMNFTFQSWLELAAHASENYVMIILDASGSMRGAPMNQANTAVTHLTRRLADSPYHFCTALIEFGTATGFNIPCGPLCGIDGGPVTPCHPGCRGWPASAQLVRGFAQTPLVSNSRALCWTPYGAAFNLAEQVMFGDRNRRFYQFYGWTTPTEANRANERLIHRPQFNPGCMNIDARTSNVAIVFITDGVPTDGNNWVAPHGRLVSRGVEVFTVGYNFGDAQILPPQYQAAARARLVSMSSRQCHGHRADSRCFFEGNTQNIDLILDQLANRLINLSRHSDYNQARIIIPLHDAFRVANCNNLPHGWSCSPNNELIINFSTLEGYNPTTGIFNKNVSFDIIVDSDKLSANDANNRIQIFNQARRPRIAFFGPNNASSYFIINGSPEILLSTRISQAIN